MPHTGDRRVRRRDETRFRLIAAGRRLIGATTVESLKIRELAEEADVGHGSFYNHFASKEDFVDAVMHEALTEVTGRVVADIPSDAEIAVRASESDRRFLALAHSDPDFARLLINLNHREDVLSRVVKPFAEKALLPGVTSGRFDIPDFDALLIVLTSSGLGMIRAILDGNAPADADVIHAEYVLRMLGLPAAEAAEISRRPLA